MIERQKSKSKKKNTNLMTKDIRVSSFLRNLSALYSQRQKSMDGYLIRMKWPYFQPLKNIRSTARKALKLFWVNAQDSEVVK